MSWGGAYQNSQLKAYVEPYQALTGVTVTWDESSNEAIAKLRAAQEALERRALGVREHAGGAGGGVGAHADSDRVAPKRGGRRTTLRRA